MAKSEIQLPSWLEKGKLYTVTIFLSTPAVDGKKGLQYINVIPETIIRMQDNMYQKGIAYYMPETGTTELISPFNINQVLVLQQKNGKI